MLYEVITERERYVFQRGVIRHEIETLKDEADAFLAKQDQFALRHALQMLARDDDFTRGDLQRRLRRPQGGAQEPARHPDRIVITSYSIHYTKLYDTQRTPSRRLHLRIPKA